MLKKLVMECNYYKFKSYQLENIRRSYVKWKLVVKLLGLFLTVTSSYNLICKRIGRKHTSHPHTMVGIGVIHCSFPH